VNKISGCWNFSKDFEVILLNGLKYLSAKIYTIKIIIEL